MFKSKNIINRQNAIDIIKSYGRITQILQGFKSEEQKKQFLLEFDSFIDTKSIEDF